MTQSNQKPVAIITGASSGIGDTVARRFAAGGFDLVVVARRKERLDSLAESLSGVAKLAILAADVTAENTPKETVELAMSTFGRLDCLVNNAGAGTWAPVHETTDAILNEVIDISLKAPFRFCREALAVMKSGASIINVGSVFGTLGGLDGGAYCAVKAGLVGLTQTMAAQYGSEGIRTNLVAPGVIRTEMTDAAWMAEPFRRLNHEMTPFHREGTTEDVANAIYFLATESGGYINGQCIALDGGWSTTKYLSREALLSERK
jgi:meso-butanediol dehydrogenase/(S,S)-butanediol dehydrogenase/diacetyl reductase